MTRALKYTSLLMLYFGLSLGLQAQVEFTASVNKNQVAKGERFTIEFSINQQASNFKAPSFGGFRVLSGPNTSISTYADNRGFRKTISYSYILEPQSLGEVTIGPAFITVEGEVYKTEPIDLTITEKSQSASDPDSPESKARDNVFLRALVSKSKIYQGEPIFAHYKLYFRSDIGQPQLVSEPDFTGFYKEEVEQGRIQTQSEVIDGQRFTTGDIRQMVLIPQKSGRLEPGEAKLNVPTQIPTGRYDFFGRPVGKTIQLELSEAFPTLEVKPLPLSGKPNDFSGAVGSFDFEATVNTTELTTDESVTLTLSLKGNGNIKLASLPEIEFPQAFEVFDPELKENSKVGRFGMRGSKTAEYLLVPRYSGTYKIGPISFTYFDPEAERYRTATSPEFEIKVSGGIAPPSHSQQQGVADSEKEKVDFIGKDILFIKTQAQNWQQKGQRFLGSTAFYFWLTAILLLTALLFIYYFISQSRGGNRALARQQKAAKMARKHLAKAKKQLDQNNTEDFYQALSSALWGYFSDKLAIPQSKMNKEYLAEELKKKQIADDLQQQVFDMMNRAEMARYTAVGGINPASDYSETTRVLTEIEKAI